MKGIEAPACGSIEPRCRPKRCEQALPIKFDVEQFLEQVAETAAASQGDDDDVVDNDESMVEATTSAGATGASSRMSAGIFIGIDARTGSTPKFG